MWIETDGKTYSSYKDMIIETEVQRILEAASCGGVKLRRLPKQHLTWTQAINLILDLQDALGTEEEGQNLVEVARAAHKAEQELAWKVKWEDHEQHGIERAKAEGRYVPR
jgi:hypothetical protein